jgi:hypothetical protein
MKTSSAVPTSMIGSKLVTGWNAAGRRQRDVGAERLRAEMQRVAVGGRRCGCGRADVAAAAGRFLDHDLLAPHFAELSAMKRPSTSIAPDGENAITILTGRLGNPAPSAAAGHAAGRRPPPARQ